MRFAGALPDGRATDTICPFQFQFFEFLISQGSKTQPTCWLYDTMHQWPVRLSIVTVWSAQENMLTVAPCGIFAIRSP
jgi:hypothetical protein